VEGDDVSGPGQDERTGKSDQQIFDEQVARSAGKAIVIFGSLGILAALVMSAIALVISSDQNTKTVTVQAASTAGQSPTAAKPPALTGDALGAQVFVSGNPGAGAIGCGSCHTMKAAGTTGTVGPNLDKELTADPASATLESIVNPNKEIATGYSANIMPTNYGAALTKQELDALANYIYHSTNIKAKAKAKRASGTTSTTP
jgi:mono/diheme cytochrome c family protein